MNNSTNLIVVLFSLLLKLREIRDITVSGENHTIDSDAFLKLYPRGTVVLYDGYDNHVRSWGSHEDAERDMRQILADNEGATTQVGDLTATITKDGIKVGCQNISFEQLDELNESVARVRSGESTESERVDTVEALTALISKLSNLGTVRVNGTNHTFDSDSHFDIRTSGRVRLFDGYDNQVESYSSVRDAIDAVNEILSNNVYEQVELGNRTAKVSKTDIRVAGETVTFEQLDAVNEIAKRVRR